MNEILLVPRELLESIVYLSIVGTDKVVVNDERTKHIIIGVVCGVLFLIVLAVVIAVAVTLIGRRKRACKPLPPAVKNGHINHVMVNST